MAYSIEVLLIQILIMKNKLILALAISCMTALVSCSVGYVTEQPADVVYTRPASPGDGYIWFEGDWVYSGGHYIRHEGHWGRARAGRTYNPGHWEHASNGYRWHKSGWRK
jgi:hypothetical protein